MQISTTQAAGVTVVALAGELDASTAPAASSALAPLAQSASRVVLDLSAVPYMSSAGLRMLLSAYRQLSARGGSIALAGVVDEIRDTMAVTGFLKFFVVHTTVDEAVAALAA